MRYDGTRKRETRARILDAAARQLRQRGPQGVALAGVMAEAGLTHGGFYAHFPSRDALLDAAVDQMCTDSPVAMLHPDPDRPPGDVLGAFVDYYLSAAHRDTRTGGCPLPFLAADAPRLGPALQEKLARSAAGLARLIARPLAALGHRDPDAVAQSCVCEIVGAVMLARAEADRDRSDLILARSRSSVRHRMGLEYPA